MIQVASSGGSRVYTVPIGLRDLALQVFPGMTNEDAFYRLARSLSLDELATLEALMLVDWEGAMQRAAELMAARPRRSAESRRFACGCKI